MPDVSAALSSFVIAVDADQLGVYGVHISVGSDEAHHRWRSDDRENIYSVSKGMCALAAGLAIEEGIASLDTRVGELLPDIELGPDVDSVTLEHLLTMSSGIDFRWFGHEPVPGQIAAACPTSAFATGPRPRPLFRRARRLRP